MEQDELVAAFTRGLVVGPVERIDTHLSHIFLTKDRAYKLKRALRLPFVDFRTLQSRKAACEAELTANRRFAAKLYLDVLPVTRRGAQVALGGQGDVVDWVVEMRRFVDDTQFDRLAAAGRLDVTLARRTAEAIARAHADAPVRRDVGSAADYLAVIRELRATEEDGARKLGIAPASPALFEKLGAELERVGPLIESRREQGRVRRGHGDLHLRNICMFEGKPTPFDALEFDERLATTDVLYDLAFLLMDLRHVGLSEHANAVMNTYWDVAGEADTALALLPLFMSLRATVRMAVAIESGSLPEAGEYRHLALSLLEPAWPRMIAIGGLSGSGKSAVAAALAPLLAGPVGARVLRSDVVRKQMIHVPLGARAGKEAYAYERRADVYREMDARAADAVGGGATVIADATFQGAAERLAISQAGGGAPFLGFWLQAPLEVRLERVRKRTGDASDADVQVAAAQAEPKQLDANWRIVDARAPVDEIAQIVLRGVRSG